MPGRFDHPVTGNVMRATPAGCQATLLADFLFTAP